MWCSSSFPNAARQSIGIALAHSHVYESWITALACIRGWLQAASSNCVLKSHCLFWSMVGFLQYCGFEISCLLLGQHSFDGVYYGLCLSIYFDVDPVSLFFFPEDGHSESFRNQVNREGVPIYFSNGQAASVHGNESFREDVFHDVSWQLKDHTTVVVGVPDLSYGSCAVYVSGHLMSTNFVSHASRTFVIDVIAWTKIA
mmetsp:Transcript_5904/g.36601  ORF Transcript_5904/g.36601 Transcript_5904/m.36601 type:complete len:200 (+) Transcript_5904:2488-3087(+)